MRATLPCSPGLNHPTVAQSIQALAESVARSIRHADLLDADHDAERAGTLLAEHAFIVVTLRRIDAPPSLRGPSA